MSPVLVIRYCSIYGFYHFIVEGEYVYLDAGIGAVDVDRHTIDRDPCGCMAGFEGVIIFSISFEGVIHFFKSPGLG